MLFIIFYAFAGSKMICIILQAKSNAQKPNQRREWKNIKRKSTLSTVVLNVVPPTSSQSDNSEVPKKENNSISEANVSNIPQKMHSSRPENVPVVPKVEKNVIEPDIRLPRAMRKSVSPNGGGLPLGDMNASKPDEPVNKESEVMIEARTPVKQKRTLEKENNGR